MALSRSKRIELYRTMLRIRRFEEKLKSLYLKTAIKGFLHLSLGQEAVAAGVCTALKPKDMITTTHRGHGHAIAKGVPFNLLMAEFYAKATGCCKARGGSMHLTSVRHGVVGSNAIVGANIPLAAGAALAAKQQKTGQVIACFLGDGAVNTGAFHEGINMAAMWRLPVVYVCENNVYAISTHVTRATPIRDLADRAVAYGIPGVIVDGMDPEAVYLKAQKAISRARGGDGPSLIECKTYRMTGSFIGDAGEYRPKGEYERWEPKDPIKRWKILVDEGVLTKKDLDQMEQDVQQELDSAIKFAEESPTPKLDDAFKYVFAPTPPLPEDVEVEPDPGDRELTVWQALQEALFQIMEHDPSSIVLGEDVAVKGGDFAVTKGLLDKYGYSRVRDTPISEAAIIGVSVGAATRGLHPIAEIMFVDFIGCGMDQLLNQASKLRYMYGGQVKIPMVVRTAYGAGMHAGPQHSQSLESIFTHIPGLKVVMPSNAYDAKGLLITATLDDNPVLFFEHKLLYNTKAYVPEKFYSIPLGKAKIRHSGNDVTVLATGLMVNEALKAAKSLANEGITTEVIDPRTLAPFDTETLVKSIQKTHKLVIAHEAWKHGGVGAEIAATIVETAFDELDGPIKRVAGADVPTPFCPTLEKHVLPSHVDIIQAVKELHT